MIAHDALPRLLYGAGEQPRSLREHEEVFAPVTVRPDGLVAELAAAGVTGHGGAGFPTHRKVELLRTQRGHRKFMVVNAMEGEPASHKDLSLINANPHLVLDGAEMLAAAIGARHVAVCVERDNPTTVNAMKRAIHERSRRSQRGPEFELHTPPWRYVAGEESALVHWLNDNESLPQYRPQRPSILRVGHGPALVDNAETCAHVALVARYGAAWFRGLGTEQSPGSTLVSVTGAVARPTVLEVALGTRISTILSAAGADPEPQALLLGGYGGMWLSGQHVDAPYANESLKPLGAAVGAGVMLVIPRGACGLSEVHRITKWMAHESARQCGPCAFGLPAITEDLAQLVTGGRDPERAYQRLVERLGVINGRGACAHPDGVVRMVRSALEVFVTDIEHHRRGSACAGSRSGTHYATVPALEREEDLVWQ